VNETSCEIVKRSGSNLAFALAVLPREKRQDMRVFYAFCRVIDDIADNLNLGIEERVNGLSRWRDLASGDEVKPSPGVEAEFVELRKKYQIVPKMLLDIIEGVERDLYPLRFTTVDELKDYCYHVASAVGLVSIEIFGYTDPATRVYAEQLGYALQWTNIMRDVGEDAGEGRIFLPLEDLSQFGLTEEDLLSLHVDREKFQGLMALQETRARAFYAAAAEALPEKDRQSMRSAELMRRIYSGILDRMEADGYQVFRKRYKLSKARMIGEFLKAKYRG